MKRPVARSKRLSPPQRADPQRPRSILGDHPHAIVAQALRVGGVVAIGGEGAGGAVEAVESARRAKPQHPRSIFVDRYHRVVAQAARVAPGRAR